MNILKEICNEITRIICCNINIEEFIEMPSDINSAEYVFRAFKVSKLLKVSPNVIAKKIQSDMHLDFIDHIEVINCYVNFYIDKCKYIDYSLTEIINNNNIYYKLNNNHNFSSKSYDNNYKSIRQLSSVALYNFIANIYILKGYRVISLNDTLVYYKKFQECIKKLIAYLNKYKMIYYENNCLCINLKKYNYSPFMVLKNKEITEESMMLIKTMYYLENIRDVMCIGIYDECRKEVYKKIYTIIKIINEEFPKKVIFCDNYTIKVLNNNLLDDALFDIKAMTFYILSHKNKDEIIFNNKIINEAIDNYSAISTYINMATNFIKENKKCLLKNNQYSIDIYNEVRILNNYNYVLNQTISELNSAILCKYIITVCKNLTKILKTKKIDKNIFLLVKASLIIIKKGLLFVGIEVS